MPEFTKIKHNILETAKAVRNIYNQAEIVDYLDELILKKDIKSNNILNWIKSNLKNYLIKQHENIEIIESFNDITEDWAIRGIKDKTLSRVIIDQEFKSKIEHVIDFFNVTTPTKNLDRLAIADAIDKSIAWTENQEKQEDDLNGIIEVMSFDDGYTIQEMTSKQALLYEGYKMKHCIGMVYSTAILNGEKRAFTLRDKNNIPHATLMYDVKEKIIDEIKGNANSVLKIEYQKYIAEFLNKTTLNYSHIYDYGFIHHVLWDQKQQEFYVANKTHKNNNFYFEKSHIDYFSKREIEEYKTNHIRDNITLVKLFKSYPMIKDIHFHNLSVTPANDASEIDTLKKLNVDNLKVLLQNNLTRLESNALNIEIIPKKNFKNNTYTINNVEIHQAETLFIYSDEKVNIKSLNLNSSAISRIHLKNVTIEKLVMPKHQIKNIILENSHLPTTELNAHHIVLKNTDICNSVINTDILLAFDTSLTNNLTKISEILISNQEQISSCINKIAGRETSLENKALIQNLLSDHNFPMDLVRGQFFDYQGDKHDNVEINTDYQQALEVKAISQCKEKYHHDLENLFDIIESPLTFFNSYYLDIAYLTRKNIFNDVVQNYIYLRPDFLSFLEKENHLLEQFYLFENLRCLNEKGLNVQNFSELLKNPIHPYMIEHINYIEKNPTLYLNKDFYKMTDDKIFYDEKQIQSFIKTKFLDISDKHCLSFLIKQINSSDFEKTIASTHMKIKKLLEDEDILNNFEKHIEIIFENNDELQINTIINNNISTQIVNALLDAEYKFDSLNFIIKAPLKILQKVYATKCSKLNSFDKDILTNVFYDYLCHVDYSKNKTLRD